MTFNEMHLEALGDQLRNDGGKILVIQTAFLGDVILLTPLLKALNDEFPAAKTTVLIRPEFASLVEHFCDSVLTIDKKSANSKVIWANVHDQIVRKNFDLAIIPHRSIRSARLAKNAGIRNRIGFDRGLASRFYTKKIHHNWSEYEGRRNLKLLQPLTERKFPSKPLLSIPSEVIERSRATVRERLEQNQKYVVLAPGSVWKTKRWFVEYYKEIVSLMKTNHDLICLAVGGKEDIDLAEEVVSDSKYNLAGQCSILESAELMKAAQFVISGDTAPAHLATAIDAKLLIIWGSTTPRLGFAAPYENVRNVGVDLWCRPCSNHGRNFCPNLGSYKCLRDCTPQMILKAIGDWL